uniref:5'-3' exoribonuclease n=1 Tax=Rhabditophanes sp. KR3021 TaxID=114890 RepID=A0AC35U6U7_9BILA
MGVPAFFRSLSKKFPSIVTDVVEESAIEIDGTRIPIDWTKPNQNFTEFDNLYLDMNGIVHPCSRPEDRPPPESEDEIFVLIFEYIDRLMAIIRPRRVLYMAVDGVAPRAKMNQQRSRRFRGAKEVIDKEKEIEAVRDRLIANGIPVPPKKEKHEWFDRNCITPGTEFMERLSKALEYYIAQKLKSDPAWACITVILSDASVPGEGEHKIMDFVRKQRASEGHDPNTVHCLCGADADLIMLGLATHEVNFHIIREEFVPGAPRACDLCKKIGHELKNCDGGMIESSSSYVPPPPKKTNFIFIRLPVLREYLERELTMKNISFEFNLERAIDDWVCLCFLVGNDFLPHLPSLEIREGALEMLVRLYKSMADKCGGYLTDNGEINMERMALILEELGNEEDEIFRKRRINEERFRARNKAMKRKRAPERKVTNEDSLIAPVPLHRAHLNNYGSETKIKAYIARTESEAIQDTQQRLLSVLLPQKVSKNGQQDVFQTVGAYGKVVNEDESDSEPEDNIKFHEQGWKDRYYEEKFGVEFSDTTQNFRRVVAEAYMEGMAWVLKYYYRGCVSWDWFYPYHYAPFASDFDQIESYQAVFPTNTKPFKPLQQLMGVFPAASGQNVPKAWRRLMSEPDSEIYDFYPLDFAIDLNGKKFAWMGVALLPFVDQDRLLDCLDNHMGGLTEEELRRNVRGENILYVSNKHPAFEQLCSIYETGLDIAWVSINKFLTNGMNGLISRKEDAVLPGNPFYSPIKSNICNDFTSTCAMALLRDPAFSDQYAYPTHILEGSIPPEKVFLQYENRNRGGYNNTRQYQGGNNFNPQHNYNTQRGNYSNSRGDYNNSRGDYNNSRGGNEHRGSYNNSRGGSNRGDFDNSRGNYQNSRYNYNNPRGNFSNSRGYENPRGSNSNYRGNNPRGNYNNSHGNYTEGRGNQNDTRFQNQQSYPRNS